MKIKTISVSEEHWKLRTPFVTALRRVEALEDIVLRIEAEDGSVGVAGCVPTPVITGDTKESIYTYFGQVLQPLLTGRELNADRIADIWNSSPHDTSPRAAADIAIHDLLAKENGIPLFSYISGKSAPEVRRFANDLTISLNPVETVLCDALEAYKRGYRIMKIKLGGGVANDLAVLHLLSDTFGKEVLFRLDANQAWSVEETLHICEKLTSMNLNIDLIEQPVDKLDLSGMTEINKNTAYPIMADECVFSPEDAEIILSENAADIINIKLMKCGGLYGAEKIYRLCRSAGKECMLGCMLEGAYSVRGAVHFAAAHGITRLDLDAPDLCTAYPETDVIFNGPSIDFQQYV